MADEKDYFSKFENKYILKGEILVLTALHIGVSVEDENSDAPFIKTSKVGSYYIPGSSFRGYLRNKIERYLNSENSFKIKYKDNNDLKELSENDVKNLFGYTDDKTSLSSRVHIQDMRILTDNENNDDSMNSVTTVVRDGIKINKETGIVEDGAKFNFEVITIGNIFEFVIELENIKDYELDLILLGLNDIRSENGDLIGGKISRGIGRCRLENLEIEYVDSNDKELLKEYIFKNKLNKLKSIEIKNIFLGE